MQLQADGETWCSSISAGRSEAAPVNTRQEWLPDMR